MYDPGSLPQSSRPPKATPPLWAWGPWLPLLRRGCPTRGHPNWIVPTMLLVARMGTHPTGSSLALVWNHWGPHTTIDVTPGLSRVMTLELMMVEQVTRGRFTVGVGQLQNLSFCTHAVSYAAEAMHAVCNMQVVIVSRDKIKFSFSDRLRSPLSTGRPSVASDRRGDNDVVSAVEPWSRLPPSQQPRKANRTNVLRSK